MRIANMFSMYNKSTNQTSNHNQYLVACHDYFEAITPANQIDAARRAAKYTAVSDLKAAWTAKAASHEAQLAELLS